MKASIVCLLLLISIHSFSQRLEYDYWNYSNLAENNIKSVSCYQYQNKKDSFLLYILSVDTISRLITGKYYYNDLTVHGVSTYWDFERKFDCNDSLIYNISSALVKDITQSDIRLFYRIVKKIKSFKLTTHRETIKQFNYNANRLISDTIEIKEYNTVVNMMDTTKSEILIYRCIKDYAYDNNRLISIFENRDSVKYLETSFKYNSQGNLIKQILYQKGQIHEIKNIYYDSLCRRIKEIDTTNYDYSNPMEVRKIFYNYLNDSITEKTEIYISLKNYPDTTFQRYINNSIVLETFTSLRNNYQNEFEYSKDKLVKCIHKNSYNEIFIRTYNYNKNGLIADETITSQVKDKEDNRIRYFYEYKK